MEPLARSSAPDVTGLLRAWSAGSDDAFAQLVPLVYDELHRMARRYLVRERANVTLQPTALVNEVCLRLLGWDQARWQNRSHFFGVSAQLMRRVLVDIARRRSAERRGGADAVRVSLDEVDLPTAAPDADLVAIDDALERLAVEHPERRGSWSSVSSAGCRWTRRRGRWTSRCGPCTTTGCSRGPGSIVS